MKQQLRFGPKLHGRCSSRRVFSVEGEQAFNLHPECFVLSFRVEDITGGYWSEQHIRHKHRWCASCGHPIYGALCT